jgi:hypothetical protein
MLAALQEGTEKFEQFVDEVCSDMESMCLALENQRQWYERRCQQLADEKEQLATSLAKSLETVPPATDVVDPALQAKVVELERERESLEQELEEVRMRAADLAKAMGDQKRQMAEERAELTAELRQLRRILDKQASWIAQQSRQPASFAVGPIDAANTLPPGSLPTVPGQPAGPANNGYAAAPAVAASRDPVLGSVMSQFELLRKDLERRRAQPVGGGKKNVNAS